MPQVRTTEKSNKDKKTKIPHPGTHAFMLFSSSTRILRTQQPVDVFKSIKLQFHG